MVGVVERWQSIVIFALTALLCSFGLAVGGGPFVINTEGEPQVWNTTQPIPFHTDLGPLGLLTNAEAVALVEEALQVWEAVPSSSVSFTAAGSLPVNVTGSNVFSILGIAGDGISPIIFDHDGSVIDAILGRGASRDVLGLTAIELGVSDRILEAQAILNGAVLDGSPAQLTGADDVSRDIFLATIIHEFGHYINLDHSQINSELAFDGDVTNDDSLPTMFPIALDSESKSTLHFDDVATVSTLYPTADFLTSTGSIEGEIFLGDGAIPFQGANVIARRTVDRVRDATSYVSGALFKNNFGGGTGDLALKGRYKVSGLLPGDYTIEVEQIHPTFTGGSSLNPLDPPAILPGPEEFYNGEQEAGSTVEDNPSEKTEINVSAGEIVSDIDILLNTLKLEDSAIGLALELKKFKYKAKESGDRITAKLSVTDLGESIVNRPVSIKMWVSDDAIFDISRDRLVAMDEIKPENLTVGKPFDVKLKSGRLFGLDGKFGIVVIESKDESNQQSELMNQVVQRIGGRGCIKDSFRLERESNDSLANAQSLGKIGLSECVMVNATLTDNNNVVVDEDVFRVTVKEPAVLEITLTHDATNEFDALIFGLGRMELCDDVCSFVIPDGENVPVAIVVSPLIGVGSYTLNVQAALLD
tara:strand:- start:3174 stop:5105 length:1932 start_codon:yes stop_codon:yes gene_type:complete